MNTDSIVILLGNTHGDRAMQVVLQHLVALSERGLLRRFWYVDAKNTADESVLTLCVDKGYVNNDSLYRSIASVRNPMVTRLALALTETASPEVIETTVKFAEQIQAAIIRIQPPGIPLKSVRIAFPASVQVESPLARMFDTHADANLIAFPEDRASDLDLAAPVTVEFMDSFAAHAAAEIATQLGLWLGMDDAPVDQTVPGTINGNDVPVRFVRSYARAAIGPALPLYEAMRSGDVLPVPSRAQQSPNQWVSARDFADELFNSVEQFQCQIVDYGDPERIKTGRKDGAREYFKSLKGYLREIPRSTQESFKDDVGELGGEALLLALGEEARLEVDWIGRDPNRKEVGSIDEHVHVLTQGLIRRLEAMDLGSIESTPIDQAVWSRVVQDITGAIDSGEEATTRITAGATRLVVNDPKMVGPELFEEIDAPFLALASERIDSSAGTILGRISARIRSEIEKTNEAFAAQRKALDEAIQRAKSGLIRPLPFVTWSIGILFTVLVTLLAIGFGLPKMVGMDGWSERDRYIIGLLIAIVWLAGASACLAAAQRVKKGWARPIPWIICGGILGAAAFLWWRFDSFISTPLDFLRAPVKELIIIGAVFGCLVIGLVFAAIARNVGLRAMARLIGILLVTYLAIAVTEILVRPGGWYSLQSETAVRNQCLKYAVICGLVAIVMFVILCFYRVRQRLAYFDALRRIGLLAESARATTHEIVRLRVVLQQYLGTALAIDRVAHYPFGMQEVEVFTPPSGEDPFQALKVSLHYFELEGKALTGAIAKIRNLVASPGWINRQYTIAARAFIPEFAFLTGQDPDQILQMRPEMDTTIELTSKETSEPGVGPRWSFTRMLYNGDFDTELAQAGIELVMTDALTKFLTPISGQSSAGAKSGISEHGNELLAGQRPQLTSEILRSGLFMADDSQSLYDSTVWWPTVLTEPTGLPPRTTLRASRVNQADRRQLVLEFTRSDWSKQFALSDLKISDGSTGTAKPVSDQNGSWSTSENVPLA